MEEVAKIVWFVSENRISPLLTVHNLSIKFGSAHAVRDVSFHIAPGETLGLVGESGSGKSVTSLALMRLLPAQAVVSGSIFWADGAPETSHRLDLQTLPAEAIRRLRGRRMAMIFQEPMTALNPVMRIGEQIAEVLRTHQPPLSRRDVDRYTIASLEEVGLPDARHRMRDYPHHFSGGQRQRIVIAIALANRPSLLIADEPTTALDVTVQAQIIALLRSLQHSYKLAILFISHDLSVVRQVAHRVAVMKQGQIVEEAFAADLFRLPRHPYTQRLLTSVPTMTTERGQPLATLPKDKVNANAGSANL